MATIDADRINQIARERETLISLLLHGARGGLEWCERNTALTDEVVKTVFSKVQSRYPDVPPISIVATGGYGRREMAPYSDVDLTLIPLEEGHPDLDGAIRLFFQNLHSAFGATLQMKVGYAYRLISDAPGLDSRTRTGLLDARVVAGSPEPFDKLMELFWETFPAGAFILDKITERQIAMQKTNDTPLVVVPNLKEGAGGLRSFHCANWLGFAIGERAKRSTKAYDSVIRMRNLLHAVSKKQTDVLSRVRQGEIAEVIGRDMFSVTSELAEAMLELHAEYFRATEKLRESRFSLAPHVYAVRGEVRITGDATISQAALGVMTATRLKLGVSDLYVGTREEIDPGEAMETLKGGESTLRNLDHCGLLDVFLPELARCRTLMPDDGSHAYTVFEHSLRVIRNLDSLEGQDGFFGELYASVGDRSLLYLAALLHDVGKIDPSKSHSEVGEIMTRQLGARWRLQQSDVDLVAWLVKDHLAMDRFVKMRDVHIPETAREFAQIVGDRERLVLLTLLTWADVNAVAPDSWTPVQEAFIKELFEKTSAVLESGHSLMPDPDVFRQRIMQRLKKEPIDTDALHAFINSLPANYLLSTPPELVREHFEFAQNALAGEPTVEIFQQTGMSATDVTICSTDSPGLLSRVLGVFYAYDLSLVALRASTSQHVPPIALDVFTVTFGGRPLPPATCAQIVRSLTGVLKGEIKIDELLTQKGKDPSRKQQIFTFSYIEGEPGILEIRAPRGRGMAYRISRLIAEKGWSIQSARVTQWAGQGAAAFYILGPDRSRLSRDDVTQALS